MKKTLMLLTGTVLLAGVVHAQLYNGKSAEMAKTVDQAAALVNQEYANVVRAGAREEALSSADSYQQMTGAMNEANLKHFKEADNFRTLQDVESSK